MNNLISEDYNVNILLKFFIHTNSFGPIESDPAEAEQPVWGPAG